MRNRALGLLGAALACALAAGWLAWRFVEGQRLASPAAGGPEGSIDVIVAARPLSPGAVVGSEDVRTLAWPAPDAPSGFSRSVDEVLGRGVLLPMIENEPFLPAKMADAGAGGGLAVLVPRGSRAVSVKVDDVIGVAGFVIPGTRVDVLATLDARADLPESGTRTILQNLEVLATDQSVERDASGEPRATTVVTLRVSPDEGERLTLASATGRIQLALRNSMDLDTASTRGVRASTLLAGAAAQTPPSARPSARPAPPPPPSRTTVEVWRGSERSETVVGPGGSR